MIGKSGAASTRHWLTLSLSMVLVLCSSNLWADEDWRALHAEVVAGHILSLETILNALQQQYSGLVIDVDFEEKNGIKIYEVELLGAGGQVLEFHIDAVTGEILAIEGSNIEAMKRQ